MADRNTCMEAEQAVIADGYSSKYVFIHLKGSLLKIIHIRLSARYILSIFTALKTSQ